MTDLNTITTAPGTDALDAIRRSLEPRTMLISSPEYGLAENLLLLPNGSGCYTIAAKAGDLIEQRQTGPRRKRGTATLYDLDSFIGHVRRFADEHSVLFGNRVPTNPELVCVIDYHEGGAADGRWEGKSPRWCQHRASYTFPLSQQWKTWKAATQKPMTQADLAELLEANIQDLIEPSAAGDVTRAELQRLQVEPASPAAVLTVSRGLAVRQASEIKNAQVLATGETQLVYSTTHTDERGQPLSVPSAFLLAIPVFEGGAAFVLPVRLRYRLVEGRISWSLKITRADATLDTAVREACESARDKTGLPLFYGSPEQA